MAPVGYAVPSTLHFVVLCCAPLLRAHFVHIVTPQNTATTATTTTTTPATTAAARDTFLTAYHHAQRLRSAPANRNDLYDSPDNDPNRTYDTLIRSSHLPPEYPSLTHDFLPVSPPTVPYAPPHAPTHPSPWPHPHPHPTAHSCRLTPYSSPSTALPLLPTKLSLKLLLKILLKLVLFKMIVKLIAVICLLLFIPALKSKESAPEGDAEDGRVRRLASVSGMIWDSLEEKNWMYGDDEEMKDVREIAEQADDDEEEQDNGLSGPLKAVRFLEFCVSAVDRLVGYILGVLQRQRNDQDDLSSFVLEKLGDFVKQL